jgi:hypothetical protein
VKGGILMTAGLDGPKNVIVIGMTFWRHEFTPSFETEREN